MKTTAHPSTTAESPRTRCLAALVAALATQAACAAVQPQPTPHSAAASGEALGPDSGSGFLPRLVRPERIDGTAAWVESDGVRREVASDRAQVVVLAATPAGPRVAMSERLPDVSYPALDPSFRVLCAAIGTPIANTVGAYDLGARRWLWQEAVAAQVVRTAATPSACAFVLRTTTDRVGLRGLRDGTVRGGSDLPSFATGDGAGAYWSADRQVVALVHDGRIQGQRSIHVDLRDGLTFARKSEFWARCVDPRGPLAFALDTSVEDAARQAYLARTIPTYLGAQCTPTSDPPQRNTAGRLPDPWRLIGHGLVAHHGLGGLYLWDYATPARPRRVTGAPALVRYDDVDGQSRPLDLVAPTDGTWLGVVTADGQLVRFATDSLAPLAPIALPRLGAAQIRADEAQWQVFAGAGDHLLVMATLGGRRMAFVGDARGAWQATPARALANIWQTAEHAPDLGAWFVTDPHFGFQRVNDASGRVEAAFTFPVSWSRASPGARSPDGTHWLVSVASAVSDKAGGLYVLDARTLKTVRRFPLPEGVNALGVLTWLWTSAGLLTPTDGRSDGHWIAVDPAHGESRALPAQGLVRSLWRWQSLPDRYLFRTASDGAIVGSEPGQPELRLDLIGGDPILEASDGRMWCAGRACAEVQCALSPTVLAPYDHPACAGQRLAP